MSNTGTSSHINIKQLEALVEVLPDVGLREVLTPLVVFLKDFDEDVATLMSKADTQEEHTHQIL